MVRIHGKAFGLFVPAVINVLIRGESFERFEALGCVTGHQESLQMLFEMAVSLVVIFFAVASLSVRFMRSTWPFVQG